jgi:glucosamine-6-phosphate deaminase
MEVIIKTSYAELCKEAAEIIQKALIKKPNLVLGLATGSTPIGLYNELGRLHTEEGLDFSQVVTFNLDEYVGIPIDHPESYHTFMVHHLFNKVNIPASNIHIPQNSVENLDAFCEWYEQRICDFGGIDIQVLGIGANGHIGFNEPSSSLRSRTRLKTLDASTLELNTRDFEHDLDFVPDMAITMGVGTIMEARQCLLLANGALKAEAIAQCVEGPITAAVPASALQMHPKAVILIDEESASKLQRADYHKRAYENRRKLEKGALL